MHSVFIVVELHVIVNYIKILSVEQVCEIYVTGNNVNYTYKFL